MTGSDGVALEKADDPVEHPFGFGVVDHGVTDARHYLGGDNTWQQAQPSLQRLVRIEGPLVLAHEQAGWRYELGDFLISELPYSGGIPHK